MNKTKQRSKLSDHDLFNNPMIEAAKRSMSKDELKHFETLGRELYGDVDFETSQNLRNMPPPMVEALAYIESCLNAGFHPSYLEDNEKMLLKDAYGEKWYERFQYVEEDLNEIVTLTRNNTEDDEKEL